jgi:hypothetical protein
MSRQPGRVRVTAIGFFLSIGIFLLAGLDRQSLVGAEAEEPKVIAEYCTLWRGCMADPPDPRALYRMTRHDLGGGYYEDVYTFKGHIPGFRDLPGLRGTRDATMRIKSYRGLFLLERESRSRTFYSPEEVLKYKFLRDGEDQDGRYALDKKKYLGSTIEEKFNQLLSGQRIDMKLQRTFKQDLFVCKGPEWCDRTSISRYYDEYEDATERTDVWIPGGEENLELPNGAIPTLVFDNFEVRIWYDPVSEQIVRSSRRDSYGDYEIERLRVRVVSQPEAK